MTTRRLVLLRGGHAHVHVLSMAAREPLDGVELVLISPFARHHYSGMVPGYLQGTYEERDLAFDLREIAACAGARFVQAPAERIDAGARTVEVAGERIGWDLLSVDVGSEAAGLGIPGVRDHAFSALVRTLLEDLEEALGQSDLVPALDRLLAEGERSRRVRGRIARPQG